MNDTDHGAKELRAKPDTIGYSRTIVVDDVPTPEGVTPKEQRMVVEREVQQELAKEFPDYKWAGEQTLSDDKYQAAKEATNPRLKSGETPVVYESQDSWFSGRSMVADDASSMPKIMTKYGAAAGLGIAIMYVNGPATADSIAYWANDWRASIASQDEGKVLADEAMIAQLMGGTDPSVILGALEKARNSSSNAPQSDSPTANPSPK